MADKLSRSRREIPEATVWVDVDATGLVETRRALNAADDLARAVYEKAKRLHLTLPGLADECPEWAWYEESWP